MARNKRVELYDALQGRHAPKKRVVGKRRGGIQQPMAVGVRGGGGGGGGGAGSAAAAADRPSPVDPAALSPSDMALATKMEAYTRILLDTLHDPSSFDASICPDAEQRRVYIEVSLKGYADLVANLYEEQQLVFGPFGGDPPPPDIDVNTLMRRFRRPS